MASEMMRETPAGLVCQGRRKIPDAEAADAFNSALVELITSSQNKNPEGNTTFEDLDIAQNPIPPDQFEALFVTLATTGVHCERLRFFGCCTFDDEVCGHFATYLARLTSETVPFEIHLSDCAITTAGFNLLMQAIGSNESIPSRRSKNGELVPMYIRLENNYIDPEAIQREVDDGTVTLFTKSWNMAANKDAKVKFLVPENGSLPAQKEGSPPLPEDAPPPKQVWDWRDTQKFHQEGKGKGLGKAQYMGGGSHISFPVAGLRKTQLCRHFERNSCTQGDQCNFAHGVADMAQAAPAAAPQSVKWIAPVAGGIRPRITPVAGGIRPLAAGASRWSQAAPPARAPALVVVGDSRWSGAAGTKPLVGGASRWSEAAAAGAAHFARPNGSPTFAKLAEIARGSNPRSRSPRQQKGHIAAKPPAHPPPGFKPSKPSLPFGWEEQWSAEYGIPYYWNQDTGESAWERPAA